MTATPRPHWRMLMPNADAAWVAEDAHARRAVATGSGWVPEPDGGGGARWCRARDPDDRRTLRDLITDRDWVRCAGGWEAMAIIWSTPYGTRTPPDGITTDAASAAKWRAAALRAAAARMHTLRLRGLPRPPHVPRWDQVDTISPTPGMPPWGWIWGLHARVQAWLDTHPDAAWEEQDAPPGVALAVGLPPLRRRTTGDARPLLVWSWQSLPRPPRQSRATLWCRAAAAEATGWTTTPAGQHWGWRGDGLPHGHVPWADWVGAPPGGHAIAPGAARDPWPLPSAADPDDPMPAFAPRGMVAATLAARAAHRTVASDPWAEWSRIMGADPATARRCLSGDQMDAVVAALRGMGGGGGLILADDTGRGKGRVAATLMGWGHRTGRPVVAITENAGLFQDWRRDQWDADPCPPDPLLVHQGSCVHDPDGRTIRTLTRAQQEHALTAATGPCVMWTTYAQLRGAEGERRVRHLCRILKGNGWLLLDEAHNATGDGPTAAAITTLSRAAAGTLFASATFASTASQLRLYRRLLPEDLGPLAPIQRAIDHDHGPVRAHLAERLAAAGVLLRRNHAPPPAPEMVVVSDTHRQALEEHAAAFAAVAHAWYRLGILLLRAAGEPPGAVWRALGPPLARLQREHALLSRRAAVLEAADQALRAGDKVVIAVDGTMESALNAAADAEDQGLDPPPAATLWPERVRSLVAETLPQAALSPAAAAGWAEVQAAIRALPAWPLDPLGGLAQDLRDRGWHPGELSARTSELRAAAPGAWTRVPRRAPDRRATVAAFNAGELDVLVVTRAGCTGISLHAGRTFADQRRRVLLEWDPPRSPAHRSQFWGRVRRRDQVVEPVYRLLPPVTPWDHRWDDRLRRRRAELAAHTGADAADVAPEAWAGVVAAWSAAHPAAARALGLGGGRAGTMPVHERWLARAIVLPPRQRAAIPAWVALRPLHAPPPEPVAHWRARRDQWHAGAAPPHPSAVRRVWRVIAPLPHDPAAVRTRWPQMSNPSAMWPEPLRSLCGHWRPGGAARWTGPDGAVRRGVCVGLDWDADHPPVPAAVAVALMDTAGSVVTVPASRLLADPVGRIADRPPPVHWADCPAPPPGRWTLEGNLLAAADWGRRWNCGRATLLLDENGAAVTAWLLPEGWDAAAQPHELPTAASVRRFWRHAPGVTVRRAGVGPGWEATPSPAGLCVREDAAAVEAWPIPARRLLGRRVGPWTLPWPMVPRWLAHIEASGEAWAVAPCHGAAAEAAQTASV